MRRSDNPCADWALGATCLVALSACGGVVGAPLIDAPLDPEYACQGATTPGHVTLQRLNGTEYNNTVRDVFGIQSRPADAFAADAFAAGFDNNAELLAINTVLAEQYGVDCHFSMAMVPEDLKKAGLEDLGKKWK